jgi:hypothetical protein
VKSQRRKQCSQFERGVDALVSPKSASLRNKISSIPRSQVMHHMFEQSKRKCHSQCLCGEIGNG